MKYKLEYTFRDPLLIFVEQREKYISLAQDRDAILNSPRCLLPYVSLKREIMLTWVVSGMEKLYREVRVTCLFGVANLELVLPRHHRTPNQKWQVFSAAVKLERSQTAEGMGSHRPPSPSTLPRRLSIKWFDPPHTLPQKESGR